MGGSAFISTPLPQTEGRMAGQVAAPHRNGGRSPLTSLGALRGAINLIDIGRIAGWAQDTEHPDMPVYLEVLVDGRVVAHTLADRYREELRRAGIGRGEHGFEVALPAGRLCGGKLTVRRAADGAAIEGLPDGLGARVWRRTPQSCGAAAMVALPE